MYVVKKPIRIEFQHFLVSGRRDVCTKVSALDGVCLRVKGEGCRFGYLCLCHLISPLLSFSMSLKRYSLVFSLRVLARYRAQYQSSSSTTSMDVFLGILAP